MSGVKVTNERSAPPITAVESVEGEVDGDNVDWEPGESGVSELDQWKQPVRAATTANLTIATALNAGDSIDGVTLAAGDRVLVKDQTSALENGIYVAGTTPERAVDLDDDEEILGAVVYVIAGTVNAGTAWSVTNTAATVVDTDDIDWAAFGGGGGSALSDDCTPVPHGSLGAAETFDPADGEIHTMTLTADCTVTLTAPDCDASFMEWWVTEDGTGGWEFAWPGSVTEEGTHDTTLSTTQRVILETVDGGTSWIATWIGSASASFATPAIVLGLSAAAGAATTVIRSDATIAAFDATVPVTQAFSDAAATGSAAFAARRDHKHGMPATPASGGAADHEHILNVVFSGDGSTTAWELPAAPVDASSIAVYVTAARSIAWALSGTLLTTLTFDSAPASAANNIVIDIVAAVA